MSASGSEAGSNHASLPALRIDAVTVPGGGLIGLTHCPGRSGVERAGAIITRSLDADLIAIENWGASTMVTLVEAAEFGKLGVPDFADRAARRSFRWLHLPIRDMGVPEASLLLRWRAAMPEILRELRGGQRLLLHCAAGLGRSGTMAALVLIQSFGWAADDAISCVRTARPGAIETPEQEGFLHAMAQPV